jgi:hypothetical protein
LLRLENALASGRFPARSVCDLDDAVPAAAEEVAARLDAVEQAVASLELGPDSAQGAGLEPDRQRRSSVPARSGTSSLARGSRARAICVPVEGSEKDREKAPSAS